MIIYVVLIFIQQTIHCQGQEISYNQPELPRCPQWNRYGVTFANGTLLGTEPVDIFIDKNDTIYLISEYNEEIHIWNVNDTVPITISLGKPFDPWGFFVTNDGDIYVGSETKGCVERWDINGTKGTVVMKPTGACVALFVDIENYLYCSLGYRHQVVKQTLSNNSNGLIRVAGNGTRGSANNMLDSPRGIFVTIDFDLYVADCQNHRIQLFKRGNLTGITVTENIFMSSIKLRCPTFVLLDANGDIFIVDNGNHRIIGSRANGFYCIVGCLGTYGPALDHLHYPYSAAFDSYGNIFVMDQSNDRAQKFTLITHLVDSTDNTSTIESTYSSSLTENSQQFSCTDCDTFNSTYETIQVNVFENGCYRFIVRSTVEIYVDIYEDYFKPVIPTHYLFSKFNREHQGKQFELELSFVINSTYTLIVAKSISNQSDPFTVTVTGPDHVNFTQIDTTFGLQASQSLSLTNNTPTYSRTGCGLVNYRYIVVGINVSETNYYLITTNSQMDTYGIIYGKIFYAHNPRLNAILEDDNSGHNNQFKILIRFQMNTTYMLVITTSNRNAFGSFSIHIFGSNPISINPIDTISRVVQSNYSSQLTFSNEKFARERCKSSDYYYEELQITVLTSGVYIISSESKINTYAYIFYKYFNPLNPHENYFTRNDQGCSDNQFKLVVQLQSYTPYVLIVTTEAPKITGSFTVFASGLNSVIFKRIHFQETYSSIFTKDTQVYSRICGRTNYHYETIEITVNENSTYRFDDNNSTIVIYGYLYEHSFDLLNPTKNLLVQSNYSCGRFHFQFSVNLQQSTTYVLVVTTLEPNIRGPFSVLVYGSSNVNLTRIVYDHDDHCVLGDQCNSHIKGIGLTLDDILRNDIQRNTTFNNQSILIKIATAFIMIMFIGGSINSILSLLTFRNAKLQKVGCGVYLLASSITSLLTVLMLTVKYWFVVLTQMSVSVKPLTLQYGCILIEPILKVCVYFDAWLNACVAIERAANVGKAVQFNKRKSKRIARWISYVILPTFIIMTIIHEPIHRGLIEYTTEKYDWKQDTNLIMNQSTEYNASETYEIEKHFLCVTKYSQSVQDYNTAILFIHLTGPFLANLCSALYIILGTARQRSVTRTHHTYRVHVMKQFNEHKQLVISPIILLLLSLPRLIISLVSGCVDVSDYPWLYLCAYFISFTPPMLIFLVFVFPSKLYMNTFKEVVQSWKRQNQQSQ